VIPSAPQATVLVWPNGPGCAAARGRWLIWGAVPRTAAKPFQPATVLVSQPRSKTSSPGSDGLAQRLRRSLPGAVGLSSGNTRKRPSRGREAEAREARTRGLGTRSGSRLGQAGRRLAALRGVTRGPGRGAGRARADRGSSRVHVELLSARRKWSCESGHGPDPRDDLPPPHEHLAKHQGEGYAGHRLKVTRRGQELRAKPSFCR
jgi:hypothetical protein